MPITKSVLGPIRVLVLLWELQNCSNQHPCLSDTCLWEHRSHVKFVMGTLFPHVPFLLHPCLSHPGISHWNVISSFMCQNFLYWEYFPGLRIFKLIHCSDLWLGSWPQSYESPSCVWSGIEKWWKIGERKPNSFNRENFRRDAWKVTLVSWVEF